MTMKRILSLLTLATSVALISSCGGDRTTQIPQSDTTPEGVVAAEPEPVALNASPEWIQGATLYEVNVRQYSKEGNLKVFNRSIPRLKNMGVDILWFMPVQPIGKENRKGTLGSYYSISDYTAVNPEFGTLVWPSGADICPDVLIHDRRPV